MVGKIIFRVRPSPESSERSSFLSSDSSSRKEFLKSQRTFLGLIANDLKILRMEDWYRVRFGRLIRLQRRTRDIPQSIKTDSDRFMMEHSTFGENEYSNTELRSFLVKYGGSMQRALMECFSDYFWQPWKFVEVPRGLWNSEEFRFRYLAHLEKVLAIGSADDWYNVKVSHVRKLVGGAGFLGKYEFSLRKALQELRPNVEWCPWRFGRVEDGFWQERQSRDHFLSWISVKLNINTLDDWYMIRSSQVQHFGGIGFLRVYGDSLQRALQDHYPNHPWKPWLFDRVESGFWERLPNVKNYLTWLSSKLQIKQLDDWYKVSVDQVRFFNGSRMLHIYGGLRSILMQIYPEHTWQWDKHSQSASISSTSSILSKTQAYLFKLVSLLLLGKDIHPEITPFQNIDFSSTTKALNDHRKPMESTSLRSLSILSLESTKMDSTIQDTMNIASNLIFSNCRHPSLVYNSKIPMELDIYVPLLQLAFEYHGEQHFLWSVRTGSPENQKRRDQEKREACDRQGVTLLEIPYWWNLKIDILYTMLFRSRPDIVLWKENSHDISRLNGGIDHYKNDSIAKVIFEADSTTNAVETLSNKRMRSSPSILPSSSAPNGFLTASTLFSSMQLSDHLQLKASINEQGPIDLLLVNTIGKWHFETENDYL